MSMDIKQVIVVPNHLRSKLRHGKLAAQCSHASMAAFLSGHMISPVTDSSYHMLSLEMEKARHEWITNAFTKVVLRCKNEEELLAIEEKCRNMLDIPYALITDSGRTVFSEPTITCLGIGPLPTAILNPLVGHLKLY